MQKVSCKLGGTCAIKNCGDGGWSKWDSFLDQRRGGLGWVGKSLIVVLSVSKFLPLGSYRILPLQHFAIKLGKQTDECGRRSESSVLGIADPEHLVIGPGGLLVTERRARPGTHQESSGHQWS